MQPRTLTLPDDESYQQLVRLAEAAGLHVGPGGLVSRPIHPDGPPKRSREELLAIILKGGDGKSIPDPLAWQREIRQDRPLPGREAESTEAGE